jgi:methionyl-tRNA synthetase
MNQKKCPHCGVWSDYKDDYDASCEHCGQPLFPVELKRKAKKKQDDLRKEKEWMFYINPDDSAVARFFKKSGNLFYTVFMAIMTFIMWLIAALPG